MCRANAATKSLKSLDLDMITHLAYQYPLPKSEKKESKTSFEFVYLSNLGITFIAQNHQNYSKHSCNFGIEENFHNCIETSIQNLLTASEIINIIRYEIQIKGKDMNWNLK